MNNVEREKCKAYLNAEPHNIVRNVPSHEAKFVRNEKALLLTKALKSIPHQPNERTNAAADANQLQTEET